MGRLCMNLLPNVHPVHDSASQSELLSITGLRGVCTDDRTGEIVLDVFVPDSGIPVYLGKPEQLERDLGASLRFDYAGSPLRLS